MRINDLIQFMVKCILARKPIMVTGGPGCGKSDSCIEATVLANADVMLLHPICMDSTDGKGFPVMDLEHNVAKWLPFEYLHRMMTATKLLVVVLEDFGQAAISVQASWMQLLLARELNGKKISPFVTFIVLTNRREDKAGVSAIIEPVKTRFLSIVDLTSHIEDHHAWASTKGNFRTELCSFLIDNAELLYKFKPSADMTVTPTPRGWSHVNDLLNMELEKHVELEAIQGAVGNAAAMQITAYMYNCRRYPAIDTILLNPQKGYIPDETDMKRAVAIGLGMRAQQSNMSKLVIYAKRLEEAGQAEFANLMFQEAFRKDPGLMTNMEALAFTTGSSKTAKLFR